MEAEDFDTLTERFRTKAAELLDEARELYHEAAREKGDASDERLILADSALLLVRALFAPSEVVPRKTARVVARGSVNPRAVRRMVKCAKHFRGAAKLARPNAEETLAAFGERLKRHRIAAGKSQAFVGMEIGQRTGSNSGSCVAKWETGRRAPELHNLLRLCESLHVPLEKLVYGEPEE